MAFVPPARSPAGGIDTSFRDPSGNHFRLTQLRQEALV
jgi:hypothetical protein